MPLELRPAPVARAPPDVLVIDLIAVFGRDFHPPIRESVRALRSPGLETRAVGLVFDPGDHEVRQVAEFVGEDIKEAGFVVDDFFGEFDRSVVVVSYRCWV